MKKISFIVFLTFFCNTAMADCNWNLISKDKAGVYEYPVDCHIAVGKLVNTNKLVQGENVELRKALDDEKSALDISQKRTQLWTDTSLKQNEDLNKIIKIEDSKNTLHFVLGALTMAIAVWGAGQLKR